MSYSIMWQITDRVISVKNDHNLTIPDIKDQSAILCRMMDKGTYPVHIITDNSKLREMPHNLRTLTAANTAFKHHALGMVVEVSSKRHIINTIRLVMSRDFDVDLHQVACYDTALAFLKTMDNTLPISAKI